MRLTRRHLTLLVIVQLAALPAAAQGVITGIITDDATRGPLQGVEVLVEGKGRVVTTGPDGLYRLDGLRVGVSTVLFRLVGYRPIRLRVVLLEGDTLRRQVPMERATVELPPLEVSASRFSPGMEAYADRKSRGFGTFIDPEELRRSEHRKLGDLLRKVPSVQPMFTYIQGRRVQYMVSTRSPGLNKMKCPMAIWVDGIRVFAPTQDVSNTALKLSAPPPPPPPDIDQWTVHGLEAIEVYRGAAETPVELSGTGASCGTIALWTRRR